jgi:phospholipid transport system substrate-binding protein
MIRRFLPLAAVAAFVISGSVTTTGAMADQAPRAFVDQLGHQAIQVMGPSVPFEQRAARFAQLFRADFAVQQIGQFVMGPYSRTASPEERQQFLQTFSQSISEAYAKRLADYAGEPFQVTGERQQGGETVVSSRVPRPNGGYLEIEWSLIDEGGQPKISDVKIDGLSMRVQERELFGNLMQQSGGRMDIALVALRKANAPDQPMRSP